MIKITLLAHKACVKCNKSKPVSEFPRRYTGYRNDCKVCNRNGARQRYVDNADRYLQTKKLRYTGDQEYKQRRNAMTNSWYANNKDQVSAASKKYYQENREQILAHSKVYYQDNKLQILSRDRAYQAGNRDKINKRRKNKLKTDVNFRLGMNLRHRVKNSLRSGSAVRDLGCTIDELRQHLESKFQPGMTWDNYGLHGWHIDHIRPLANFSLENREEFLKAAHYTNLQPLWAKDNLVKGNR
jgi:hypothetical protein